MIIIPATYRQLLDDPHSETLFAEYAEECSLPELGPIAPQRELYEALEASGGMRCFGVYHKMALVGFVTILIYVLPHYGKKIATTESIFLSRKHRTGWAGMEMLRFIEAYAKESGCAAVLYTTPEGSRFSTLLSIRDEYRHSNNVFMKGLV
jgi:GNAT superfamily N-acetyltransferase